MSKGDPHSACTLIVRSRESQIVGLWVGLGLAQMGLMGPMVEFGFMVITWSAEI